MGQPIQGITALAGYQVQVDSQAQATPEQRYGGTADPRHAIPGEQATPYPWQSKSTQAASMHGPYGPENQLLDDEFYFFEYAGTPDQDPTMDLTPSRRAAPWPKGISSGVVPSGSPDEIAEQLRQSYEIHAAGRQYNASQRMQKNLDAQQDSWERIDQTDTGFTDVRPLDRQALSSGFMYGTRDVVQSMARQNEFGFNGAHKMRRYATGAIPGNTMWLKPGGRPMAKSLPGPARPAIGPDSPFAGDNLGAAFSADGAALQNVPPAYQAPPQPNVAQPLSGGSLPREDDAIVEWW